MLMSTVRNIITDHPAYGYRRILPELRERTGLRVNHKRLRRLLGEHDLGLMRRLPAPGAPSAVRQTLSECEGQLNLVKGRAFGLLEAFSTDFTELSYAGGGKAQLMALVDIKSKWVAGWAVGPSANRELALSCWQHAKERLAHLESSPAGLIVHHDQDSVYTSHEWLYALLIEDGARVSYSENGAKDNPWIESLWGRFKTENESLIAEATGLGELAGIVNDGFTYYNQERRHSSLQYAKPLAYLHRHMNGEDTLPS